MRPSAEEQPSELRASHIRPNLPIKLGRYSLCAELGSGGMATVYLARMSLAAGLERLVALKTIHPHLAQEKSFVEMFLDEAHIAAQITHPNVCAVYDFGHESSVYYMAMEHLTGEPLIEFVNGVVQRLKETVALLEVLPFLAARIIADACEGLHAAHSTRGSDGNPLNIVHRDVSPQNLFITYDGSIKVVDFGCAKAIQRVSVTGANMLKGKVSYVAPEQLRQGSVDHRADIWALGVCLWETLVLSQLFRRETAMQTVKAVLEEPIPLASAGRHWVPAEVARIADKALKRNPAERYTDAREMGRDLRRFINEAGATVESAELAEWMRYLFEDRRKERLALTAKVNAMDVSAATPLALIAEARPEDIELIDSVRDMPGATPAQTPAKLSLHHSDLIEGPARRRRRGGPGAIADEDSGATSGPRPLGISDDDSVPSLPKKRSALVPLFIGLVVLGGLALGGWFLYTRYLAGGNRPEPEPAPAPVEETPEPIPPEPPVEEPTGAEVAPPVEETPEPTPPVPTETERTERDPRGEGPVTTVASPRGGGTVSAEPPGEPPPATPLTGNLRIRATGGWAEVYEGARLLGRTPVSVELPAGRYTLRILPYGQTPATTTTVTVYAGDIVTVPIEVQPQAPRPDPQPSEGTPANPYDEP